MKIGIDFDDTIVNTKETVRLFMEKYNIKEFNTEEDKTVFYRKYIDEMMNYITLKDDVIEVLNRLKVNNELYMITARSDYYSKNLIDLTLKYIKDKNIPIDNIYFKCGTKVEKCLELGIDIYIDDDINNCKLVSRHIKTFIFGNELDGVHTVHNWLELEKKVNIWKKEL